MFSDVFERFRQNLRELGHLTPMALVATFLPIVGSSVLLIFLLPIGNWLRDNWEVGIGVFILATLFFCGLALLPTNVIGIVSGWAFSFELGLLVLMAGVIGSAVISFLVNLRLSGERLPEAIKKHPRTNAIYRALLREDLKKTALIITLLRMSVIMPFSLTNLLMAASRVPVRAFVIGTAAGMLPRSAAMAYVGSGLSELNSTNTRETYLLVIGIAASIVSTIVIAILSRMALERLTRNEHSIKA